MNSKRKGLLAIGLAMILIAQGGWEIGSAVATAFAQERTEEWVNVSAGRGVGFGACYVHDAIGFCIKNWATDTTAMCACLLAPTGGGRPCVLAKAERKLVDTAYLDGYLAVGAEIPIGGDLDWQRFDGSVGMEWSFPDIPEFAFSTEVGISMLHYLHWGKWYWRSESFVGVGATFYL